MREDRRVRLIRKSKPHADNESSPKEPPTPAEPSERELKNVVSRWVREHRQRSEEFQRTFAAMLKGGGFHLPTS